VVCEKPTRAYKRRAAASSTRRSRCRRGWVALQFCGREQPERQDMRYPWHDHVVQQHDPSDPVVSEARLTLSLRSYDRLRRFVGQSIRRAGFCSTGDDFFAVGPERSYSCNFEPIPTNL
jgi:hypothetical protein